MMRFAIIDLGTNTFNLLIAELDETNKKFTKIHHSKSIVKLGEETINLGYISPIPFKRGVDSLITFKDIITEYNVETIYAFATSAIRTANNGDDFITEVYLKTKLNIQIINGDEEAELIYYGNKLAVKMTDSVSLIMDIGGGSTEFILANKNGILWKQSFLLGAARLFEKFKLSDPLQAHEEALFNLYLKKELQPLLDAVKLYKPTELIGSSGAFDSVVDLIAEHYNGEKLIEEQIGYAVDISHYKKVSELIKKSTLAERQTLNGLLEMRIDMIVISVLLINFILKEIDLQNIRVSTYSLKEGVINKYLLR